MALSWITEPIDQTIDAGESMIVGGSVDIPQGLSSLQGESSGLPFLDANYTKEGLQGTTTWGQTTALMSLATGATTYRERLDFVGQISRVRHNFVLTGTSVGSNLAVHAIRSNNGVGKVRYIRIGEYGITNGMGVDVLYNGVTSYEEFFTDDILEDDDYDCAVDIVGASATVSIIRTRAGVVEEVQKTFQMNPNVTLYSTLSTTSDTTILYKDHEVYLDGSLTTFTTTDNNSNEINTKVSADGVYSHSEPNMQDSSTGVWNLKAVRGGEEISSPFDVSVSSGFFEYIGNYNVSLKLAMTIRDAWNGNNSIFDEGSTADVYTFDGDVVTTNYDIWERLASNEPSVQLNASGFFPFGTHFLGDVFGNRYPRYVGKANFHGDFQEWKGEMVPDSSGGYTYDTTAWVPSVVTGFGIAGLVNFPMPVCTANSEYSISYDRAGNVIREYDKGEDKERRQFSIKWSDLDGDALRSILVQIITVIRGNTFVIDFGSNLKRLSPWLPRDGESLSGEYDIRLSSPVINYTYTGGGLWELTIEVIKWEQ